VLVLIIFVCVLNDENKNTLGKWGQKRESYVFFHFQSFKNKFENLKKQKK